MKRALLILALFLIAPSLAFAAVPAGEMPKGVYHNDPAHSSLTWRVSHLGLSHYTARFARYTTTLTYDPIDPEDSKLEAEIDINSLRTDYPFPDQKDFDAFLAKDAEWFNGETYPKAVFVSRTMKQVTPTTGVVKGDLTFRGITKPVSLEVTFNGGLKTSAYYAKPVMGFSVHGHLKRSEWNFVAAYPLVGDDVDLLIETELMQE